MTPASQPGWPKPSAGKKETVLLVEGVDAAMGGISLGWTTLALPQAHELANMDCGAARMLGEHLAARMLGEHLATLRDAKEVLVMPDADGDTRAAQLIGWLRAGGCHSRVATLSELHPDAPNWCKDLAHVAIYFSGHAIGHPAMYLSHREFSDEDRVQ